MLNVEKLVLSSRRVGEAAFSSIRENREGREPGNLVVRLDAKTYGRHRDGPEGAFKHVVYDVVLEPALDRSASCRGKPRPSPPRRRRVARSRFSPSPSSGS